MFEGGVTDSKVVIPKFGKRGAGMGKLEIVREMEKEFEEFIKDETPSGDAELDEMRNAHIALEAFREVDDTRMADSMEEEKLKKSIIEKLLKRK